MTEHDRTGYDVALRIARQVASAPSNPVAPKKRRRPRATSVEYSGSGADARDPQTLQASLGQLIEAKGWQNQMGVRQFVQAWPQVVGATNAKNSWPEEFRDGVLVVRATSTAWATQLRKFSPMIVRKINETVGQGSCSRVDIKGPTAPSWKHGKLSVRDGRGPRDTYG